MFNFFGNDAPMAPVGTAVAQQGAVAPVVPNVAPTGPVAPTNTGPGFFQEGGMAQLGLGAAQTIGTLWSAFQQNKLARESLSLQRDAYTNNLGDQRQSYNTALEDRIRSRYAVEGRSDEAATQHINEHSL